MIEFIVTFTVCFIFGYFLVMGFASGYRYMMTPKVKEDWLYEWAMRPLPNNPISSSSLQILAWEICRNWPDAPRYELVEWLEKPESIFDFEKWYDKYCVPTHV
jgi:hypothetical protein